MEYTDYAIRSENNCVDYQKKARASIGIEAATAMMPTILIRRGVAKGANGTITRFKL